MPAVTWQLGETYLEEQLGAGPGADWLRASLAEVRAEAAVARREDPSERQGSGAALARHFTAAGRRLGHATMSVGDGASGGREVRLTRDGLRLFPGRWATDELGRASLVSAAIDVAAPARAPTGDPFIAMGTDGEAVMQVEDLFRGGDLREQQTVARCLAHLPGPERFLSLAVEIVRSNTTVLLEAIACDNPFPSAHLPEAAFNQMVVKCLFVGLPLAQIVGLAQRRSPELERMVAAFASERRAAGRPVPDDASSVS
jgi:hypothetical protein